MSRETLSLSKWFELFRPKPQMLHNQSLWHQLRGVMAPASCRSSHGAARAQEPGSERTIQWETPQTNSQWIIVGCNLNDFALGGSGLQTSRVTDASMFTVCHITGKEERRPATHHKWPLLQMSLLTHTVVRKLVKLCFNDCNLQILVTRSLTNTLFLGFFWHRHFWRQFAKLPWFEVFQIFMTHSSEPALILAVVLWFIVSCDCCYWAEATVSSAVRNLTDTADWRGTEGD